jgi:hypothetical protein
LSELAIWLGTEAADAWPPQLAGQCSGPLRDLTPEQTTSFLEHAARIRLERKARELQARARQTGWEQALMEGLFRALGYKHNVWPMQRIAELLPQFAASSSPEIWQARLLGVSGLLPSQVESLNRPAADYVRQLWDHWWRERDRVTDGLLPRSLWRLGGLRPANHPHRRLAAAAHWLADGRIVERLEKWFTSEWKNQQFVSGLAEILCVEKDDFWSSRWSVRSAKLAKSQPLLGATRVTDLAINVILPWCWIRAIAGQNETLRCVAEQRYFAWPAAQDNAVLRLARRRLLGSASAKLFRTAAAQQGLMQIVRDFCEHSNATCAECRFPGLVNEMIR